MNDSHQPVDEARIFSTSFFKVRDSRRHIIQLFEIVLLLSCLRLGDVPTEAEMGKDNQLFDGNIICLEKLADGGWLLFLNQIPCHI